MVVRRLARHCLAAFSFPPPRILRSLKPTYNQAFVF
ncbi:hypothetical protein KL86PLE_60136 [uncultured Pleomorphomonas sp.]|uniref:Uncharacterized protein n=1 Tax=uncultured Pleomorphomonas sp. TaxID=442121 RepID=A0A212LJU3_9HYPH|nr:hypothetical protein KL86PLE_60136 [uncultured Pleomorphomonas sp.]